MFHGETAPVAKKIRSTIYHRARLRAGRQGGSRVRGYYRGMPSSRRTPVTTGGVKANDAHTPRRHRPWLVFVASWALLSALSILWSIATPLAAAPDEPAHTVKAASVARGQFVGDPGPEGSKVSVPQYIAFMHGQTCPANNDEVPANCIPPVPGDPAEIVGSATTAGLYNPVYYLMVGWPSLIFQDSTGVFAIRIVSGIISSAFLALAVMMISGWRNRRLPLLALATAITPMVLFLNGSVNPNSVEITATLAAFVAMLSIIRYPARSLLTQRAVILIISAAIAANTRGLSPLWLAVALFAPFMLASRDQIRELLRTPVVRVAIVSIAAAVSFALIWLRASNNFAPSVELPDDRPGVVDIGASPFVGFAKMMVRIVPHLREMVGVFGWLDTESPVETYALWALLMGGLLLGSFAFLRGRRLAFVAALVTALILLPALVQAAFIMTGGWIWQGRYALPLLVLVLIAAGSLLASRFEKLPQFSKARIAGFVCAAWAFTQGLTFISTINRYATGSEGSWLRMLVAPDWAPPGGAPLLIGLFAVVITLTGVLGYRLTRPALAMAS